MSQDNSVDPFATKVKVAKKQGYSKLQNKVIWLGIFLVSAAIGFSALLPERKAAKPALEQEEKPDHAFTLNQNIELLASLKDKSKQEVARDDEELVLLPSLELQGESIAKETLARMNAPSTFFSSLSNEKSESSKAKEEKTQAKTLAGNDANSNFINQQNEIASVSAKRLPHPTTTVPAGEMIPATLETAIDSELAGMVRAITTRDIYALSGDKLLIPKGSTLVGQFNTAVAQGQSRIFVVWNRLQMANGIIVTLNSPSSDAIGRAGLAADYINRHFFQRFATGSLFSVLGAYSAAGGVKAQDEYNSLSQYRMNLAGSFQQAANQSLQQEMQIPTNLQKYQGTSINVFVAQDLDFYAVARKS